MRKILSLFLLLGLLSVAFSGDEDSTAGESTSADNVWPEDFNFQNTGQNADTIVSVDDNNILQQPVEQTPIAPSVSFVSPLPFEVLSGVRVVIVSLQNFLNITAHWLSFNGEDFNGTISENSLSADINTLRVPNGTYGLGASVCEGQNCYSDYISVAVLNTIPQSDENALGSIGENASSVPAQPVPEEEVQAEFFSLKPSNLFSMLSVFDSQRSLVDSGSEAVHVPKGTYSAKISFLSNGPLLEIDIANLEADSNATLFEIRELPVDSAPARKWAEWTSGFYFSAGHGISGASVEISVPEGAGSIFTCHGWSSSQNSCPAGWEKFPVEKNAQVVSIPITPGGEGFAVGFASVSKSFKRFEVLSQKKSFRADEKAEFILGISDETLRARGEEKGKSPAFRAVLRGPEGESEISPELLEEISEGEYFVSVERSRSFRPGVYRIALETEEEGEQLSEEIEFAWGLISLNTKKSIYRPGEFAEFEIVALDSIGKPVCGAELEMEITSPDSQASVFSTAGGSILPGEECGLYSASYKTSREGVYAVSLSSGIAQGRFDTNFLVGSKYDFEIVRSAQSKLDPTKGNNFVVSIDVTPLEGNSFSELREYVPAVFDVDAPGAQITEFEGVKEITWQQTTPSGESAKFEYSYSVPLDWPMLYTLGPAKITSSTGEFYESRPWYVAVDPQLTLAFHVTEPVDWDSSEPEPNDAASGDSFTGTSVQTIYGMHPSGPNVLGGSYKTTGTTTVGNYKGITWVSPPLAAQTIPSGTWVLRVWSRENNASDNLRLRVSIMAWADANDSKRGDIKNFAGTSAELGTTIALNTITMPAGNAITVSEGDKLLVEIDFNSTSSTLANSRVDFNFNQLFYDGNITAPGSITLESGQQTSVFHVWSSANYQPAEPMPNDAVSGDSFTGTSTQSFFLMRHNPPMGGKLAGPYKMTGTTTVGNYKGVTWVSPPLAAQTIPAGTWTFNVWAKEATTSDNLRLRVSVFGWDDANDSMLGPIKMFNGPTGELSTTMAIRTAAMAGGSAITFGKKDKLVVEVDFNATTSTVAAGRVDFNWSTTLTTLRDANIIASADINLYAENSTPSITMPSSDDNSGLGINTNFLVNATAYCSGSYFDCGQTSARLQWCESAGCSNWADANSSSGAVQLVSGQQPAIIADFNSGDVNSSISWVAKAVQAGTYELRVHADGYNTDANTSSGTDRTITISGGADDYSFTLSLPSSGCTQGKGSIDAGTSCDRAYFEPTDLSGNSDSNQIDPEGQTSGIYFFVYDNQSTSSSDLNITLDLNAALPSTLVLKAGRAYGGYAGTCTGNPDSGCITLSTTPTSVGKATYSAGAQDLNVFLWSDFVDAVQGLLVDRNVNSTGVSPT